jgi:regulator of protease activity HflC (stomatin/prohibitin superfamily)
MTRQTFLGVIVAILLVVLSNSLYVIRETERGVLLKFGEVVDGQDTAVEFAHVINKRHFCV